VHLVSNSSMKHDKSSHGQHQPETPLGETPPIAAADLGEGSVDFAPTAEEVARRAYFSYMNQGSLPGHDVQHWLEAEADLVAERKLTRAHAFHNRT